MIGRACDFGGGVPGGSAVRSRRPASRLAAASLFLAALVAGAPLAAADPPATPAPAAPAPKKVTQADRDAARGFAEQGFEKFQQRKYSEAIALFTKAEEHFHAPTHVAFLARAHEKRGELIEAAETYRKLLAEALPKDAPQPFRDAQAEAGPALESLARRTPKLRVDLTGEGADRARVTASDKPITPGASALANPGAVVIRVTAEGLAPLERTVILPESATEVSVRFQLARPYSIAWPVSALALGVGLGAASVGAGIYSHDLIAGANGLCAGLIVCPQDQIDQMASQTAAGQRLRDASIGLGIAGGVMLAAGITLFALRRTSQSSVEPPSAAAPASLAILAGPSFTGISGSF